MKFKDKNQLVLAISAALIVVAVLIAVISFSVEKSRVEKGLTTNKAETADTTAQGNIPAVSGTANTPGTAAPDTTAPIVTGDNIPGKYKVNTQNDPLGVRLTPESSAERIYELQKGSEIEIKATYKDWAYVQIDGVDGWVAKQYLELTEKGDAPKHANGKYIINTQNDPLGIRVKPQSDAERNGEVPKGASVEVLTVCGEWGYVEYDGKSGWLSFQYLKAE